MHNNNDSKLEIGVLGSYIKATGMQSITLLLRLIPVLLICVAVLYIGNTLRDVVHEFNQQHELRTKQTKLTQARVLRELQRIAWLLTLPQNRRYNFYNRRPPFGMSFRDAQDAGMQEQAEPGAEMP